MPVTRAAFRGPGMFPRICYIGGTENDLSAVLLDEAAGLEFDYILIGAGVGGTQWQALSDACQARELRLLAHLDIAELDINHPLVRQFPESFSVRYESEPGAVTDPRETTGNKGRARFRPGIHAESVCAWWNDVIAQLTEAGVSGICARKPASGAPLWEILIAEARARTNRELVFIAETPGTNWHHLPSLARCRFDFTLSSLPWWDGRAGWLIEEHEALRRVAEPIALVEGEGRLPPVSLIARHARLAMAALTGSGILVPAEFLHAPHDGRDDELRMCARRVSAFLGARGPDPARLAKPTGAGAAVTVVMRMEGADARLAIEAFVGFVNPDPVIATGPRWDTLGALGDFEALKPIMGIGSATACLAPGEARLAVLGEIPEAWADFVADATAKTRRCAQIASMPAIEYQLYQTLVGVWPFHLVPDHGGALSRLSDRIVEWRIKSLREAKQQTSWSDAAKQRLIARLLALRKMLSNVFQKGSYEPLAVKGPRSSNVLAFQRRDEDDFVLIALPCLCAMACIDARAPIPARDYSQDTEIRLAEGSHRRAWRSYLANTAEFAKQTSIRCADLFARPPAVTLVSSGRAMQQPALSG